MIRTTLGQLLINDALPEELRDYNRTLDKNGIRDLYREVAQRFPDRYVEISKKLNDIGREAATESGGTSAAPEHLSKAKAALKHEAQIRGKLKKILDNDRLTPQQRSELVIRAVGASQSPQMSEILQESLAEKNPFALQVLSGSRGNEMNLTSLRGSDLLYADHHDNVIPIPVLRSYSQGLSPLEYWTGTYGARRGVLATKFAVRDAGFLSKQLNQVSHRLVVTDEDHEDDPDAPKLTRGFPVDTADKDNEGSLLAADVGGYKRNTALTPKILKDLERRGFKRLLVRSAIVGGSPEGGVYGRDVGVREKGVIPGRGEQVGLQAAQALSEPLSQAQLSAKHSGGVANQESAVSGFPAINQLIQVPETFRGGAAHSTVDGRVERVEDGPAGGQFVTIEGEKHYVAPGFKVHVKRGDFVEAGDVLSEGIPDPSIITHLKGIGDGRDYFIRAAHKTMRDAGMKPHRRNLELLARGLINHVRLTEETDDHIPGDVVPYSTLEHTYKPRQGFQSVAPTSAVGKYLERPYLHYSIGTKIRPSMLHNFAEFGVDNVDVHDDPPPFEPEMIRGMYSMHHDPDWQTRLYGSGQKSSLLDAVHRGSTSNELGTSFVPSLIRGVDFGRQGIVKQPEPGTPPTTMDDTMPRTPLISPKLNLGPVKPKAPVVDWAKAAADEHERLTREAAERVQRIKRAQAYDPTGSSGAGGASSGNTTGGTGTAPAASAPTAPTATAAAAGGAAGAIGRAPSLKAGLPSSMPQPRYAAPQAAPAQYAPGGGTSYDRFARQRAGRGGGFQPGQSMFGPNDSPQAIAQFITGGHNDHTQGYGGEFGSALRFMSAIDPNAAATLTGGKGYTSTPQGRPVSYEQGNYSQGGGYDQGGYAQSPEAEYGEFNPADYAAPEPAAPAPTFGDYASATVQALPEIARNVPQSYSPIGFVASVADSPKLMTGLAVGAEAVNGTGQALSKIAPRAGSMLSSAGKAVSPVRNMLNVAGKGSTLSRAAGGKMMGAFGGALNVGWAPLEALGHLATGNTEEAKKLFYDKDYNRSLGDSSRSYLSRVGEAADPRRFYNNLQNVGSALTVDGLAETGSGALDSVAGLVGMDQQTRYNKYINSEAGKAALAKKMSENNKRIHGENTAWALQHGIGEMRNGELHPTAAWVAEQQQNHPEMSPQDIERHFLTTVYRWSSTIPGENGIETELDPTYMRQLYAAPQ